MNVRDRRLNMIGSIALVGLLGATVGDFQAAWGGISGLQLALSVVWTEARARELIRFGKDIRAWEEDESPYKVVAGIFKDRGIRTGRIGMEERQVRLDRRRGAEADEAAQELRATAPANIKPDTINDLIFILPPYGAIQRKGAKVQRRKENRQDLQD